jgi:hypothetical protein
MHPMQKSIGRARARALAETKWWLVQTPREIARIQLFTAEQCMPFPLFHRAMELSLRRPIMLHEFGLNVEGLIQEFLGERDAPTLEETLALVPANKTLLVYVDSDEE